MPSLSNISSAEFASQLTPQRLRTGMLVQAALGLGPLFFSAIVLLIAFSNQSNGVDAEALDLLKTLTIANLAMSIVLGSAGHLLYRSRFTPRRLESAFLDELLDRQGHPIAATSPEKAITFIRTAMLLRTALSEASAFFGITVLMIASTHGLLLTVSWLWVNVVPVVMLWTLTASTFPTSNTMQRIFETNIQHAG